MVPTADTLCPNDASERLLREIPAVKSKYDIPDKGHDYFAWNASPEMMKELINQIELDFASFDTA